MGLIWSKYNCDFEGEYKDHKRVHIFYTFEVKNNFAFLLNTSTIGLIRLINDCIREWLGVWVEKKWMYEGENINRLIREDKLELVNKRINKHFQDEYSIKGLHIRNIKITHLI